MPRAKALLSIEFYAEGKICTDTVATGLLDACRMGGARSDLAGMASQCHGLARKIRSDPVGLWRDGAEDLRGRKSPHPGQARGGRKSRAQDFETRRLRPEENHVRDASDQSRLDARHRADFR